MSYKEEFETVELLQSEACRAVTRGVDAFALSLIKAERQMRKLFTFLVYQYPCFDRTTIMEMRGLLASKRRIYFDGFLCGVDAVAPSDIQGLIGPDYADLRRSLDEATELRNKIFHGQITATGVSREELFDYVDQIRAWCERLANRAESELGYDGFGRDSYRKLPPPGIHHRLRLSISSMADYEALLDNTLSR